MEATDDQLGEMLQHAVYQQLFLGNDKIMGRMPSDSMSLKDTGLLLTKFINKLKENLTILDPQNLSVFLDVEPLS